MDQIMTGLTQGDQVLWRIAACLPRFDMMDIQDLVLRLALTPLAAMSISEKHIFSGIVEASLWTLLIVFPLNVRVLDLLKVKLGDLNGCFAHWQEGVDQPDGFHVSVHFVLYRRGEPAFSFLSVEKPGLSVARLSLPSGTSELSTG